MQIDHKLLTLNKKNNICFDKDGVHAEFLPSGDLFEFTNGYQMINQFVGSSHEGSVSNIYLRIYDKNDIITKAIPLRGLQSKSNLSVSKDGLHFSGKEDNINYHLSFILGNSGKWFWKITVTGDKTVDFLYVQDIGCADKGGILTNELYMSQYLGHKIFDSKNGFVVTSRQNLSQGGKNPYIAQGSIGVKTTNYSTDAMQFYGTMYKTTNIPALLYCDLPNKNYQYELSLTALQTEKIKLSNNKTTFAFFGHTIENHPNAVESIYKYDEILSEYNHLAINNEEKIVNQIKLNDNFASPLSGLPLSEKEVNTLFKDIHLAEYDKETNKLLSFFAQDHTHVVLQEKEYNLERPHGHIITSLIELNSIPQGLITSTNYMYGIFNCQTVCGNTSFNKLVSASRGLLNILKNTGQRIFVKYNNKYRILTMPSAYEMGLNYSKWYYKLDNDMIIITVYSDANSQNINLVLESLSKIKYDYIVTNQLVCGEHEYVLPLVQETKNNVVCLYPNDDTFIKNSTPDLKYEIAVFAKNYSFSNDEVFFEEPTTINNTLLCISIKNESDFSICINGTTNKKELLTQTAPTISKQKIEFNKYLDFYKNLLNNTELKLENNEEIEKLNETLYFYAHNALVHYAVPHGLEQPGGAAWGTRDVCQGPFELFLSLGHFEIVKKILIKIFSVQSKSHGEWPQWFMFDNYTMSADDCHGDIVFWPIKAIADYITKSQDFSILQELAPYKDTTTQESILEHLKIAIKSIKNRFIGDTGLITYDGGDWDDTLQPVNNELKNNLISSWTVCLAYQSLNTFASVIEKINHEFYNELKSLCEKIKTSFNKYLLVDDIIAGFGYKNNDKIELMLHPKDNTTGIHYRLLPMTRSIISELVDKKQAENNSKTIDEKLMCPDGARLMDAPAEYSGGISKIFARAEQATNVGREISLQYVHAHIRYIEAMAKLGYSEKAYNSLFTINPIKISTTVKNAMTRQANAYFSSSEGMFFDRYEYKKDFYKLKDGSIPVRGGWRIYSSGGGIYINQLLTNVLGISINADSLVLNPCLPQKLNGLEVKINIYNNPITIKYNISNNLNNITKILVDGKVFKPTLLSQSYKNAYACIDNDVIKECSVIELFI